LALCNTLEVESTTNDVVTNTWKVWYATTTNKHNGVFLEVVAFTTDVSPYFVTVGKAHTCNLTKGRVRLLWCLGSYLDTYTTFKWSILVVVTSF
jgi:hypothetical protein